MVDFNSRLVLVLSMIIISHLGLHAPSSAAESGFKTRSVKIIPLGSDGLTQQNSSPIPTPRPSETGLQATSVLDGNWCVPGNDCTGPEPITRQGFSTCEEYCALSKPTAVEGFDATLFDVSCKGDWGGFAYGMILKEYEGFDGSRKAVIVGPDGAQDLERCSDDPVPTLDHLAPQCDFNSRLYRARPESPAVTDRYHELQFVDGFTSGSVTVTEYREGMAIWRAKGEHACSNGAAICALRFPMTSGQVIEVPFEVLTDDRHDYKTIVAPAFSQNVYLSERHVTTGGYGGLVADLLNGFIPTENDLLLPQNVYEFIGCAPSLAD